MHTAIIIGLLTFDLLGMTAVYSWMGIDQCKQVRSHSQQLRHR